jgi:hypothetical protein
MKAITTVMLGLLVSGSIVARQLPANKISNSPVSLTKVAAVFGSFTAHREHDAAALSWTANIDGVSCFAIERSYDGEFFDLIDEVAPEAGRWNRYLDNTVDPGVIYYRISAWMNDGSIETSIVQVVKIVKHK